jgi:hypothetical protein
MTQDGRFEVGEGKMIPAEAKSRLWAFKRLLQHIAQKTEAKRPYRFAM